MHRLPAVAVLAAAAVLVSAANPAWAHKADPHYLTRVDAIAPALPGVKVIVINRSDRLQLTNRSGRDVTIEGYQGEPYARVLADGTVQQNTRSPATYLNEDRYARVVVPKLADAHAAPVWKTLDKTGRFEWHDHRMHWMARSRPPQVKNPDVRQKVFAWKVPLQVQGHKGAIAGTLFWTPLPGGGMPPGAILVGSIIVLALCGSAVVVRRRRIGGEPEPGREAVEAW